MDTAVEMVETTIQRVGESDFEEASTDRLAIEEPLEIRIGQDGTAGHRAVSITMRTPGNDAELAAGFLFTEGIIASPDAIKQIRHCGRPLTKNGNNSDTFGRETNTIRVDLNAGFEFDLKKIERNFYTTSSCGVCGKASIDALRVGGEKLADDMMLVSREIVHALPEKLRFSQSVFDATGGLHASALFDSDGQLDIVREDVGRHNALDKVIGSKFLAGEVPLSHRILMVSGRASFELVQKALVAGIPMLAAVSAPSSLAVDLAKEYGMTLLGFVRDGRFNIYSGARRITGTPAPCRPV